MKKIHEIIEQIKMYIFLMNVRTKMFFFFLGGTSLILFVSMTIIGIRTYNQAEDIGLELAEARATQVSLDLQKYIGQGVNAVEALKSSVTAMKNQEKPSRVELSDLCQEVLNSNKNFLAVWPMFSYNNFDESDAKYADDEMYSETQGSISYAYYKGKKGEMLFEPGAEGDFKEDYYKIPASNKYLTLVSPYDYTYEGNPTVYYEMSVSLPYVVNGKTLGVSG